MRIKRVLASISLCCFLASCKTVDFEKKNSIEISKNKIDTVDNQDNENEEEFLIKDELKENDIATSVVIIEPPEERYVSFSQNQTEKEKSTELIGSDALIQNMKDKTVLPEYKDGHLKGWLYKEESIYQIHCMTYHSTIIQLEPGEEMLEVPYISEPDVWRLSRGVGLKDGKDCQFLIIKPDFRELTSTLIIITNKRLYQMELKSFKDHYMPYVKWYYTENTLDSPTWTATENKKRKLEEYKAVSSEFLSFDYIMKHSLGKKPNWLPISVYDDGAKTYIVLDKECLHMTFPTIFNHKNELLNYEVKENIIILNQLIEKVTLKLGKDKVSIEKKK